MYSFLTFHFAADSCFVLGICNASAYNMFDGCIIFKISLIMFDIYIYHDIIIYIYIYM